jgi:succinate-acetate transporter protein
MSHETGSVSPPQPAPVSAAPLGLAAFAVNLFIVAWSFTGVLPARLVPLFLASGLAFGAVEAWVGTHEYRMGSAFTGLVFGAFGAFWVSTGLLFLLINTGTLAFGTAFQKAMGLYFLAWTLLVAYLVIGSAFVGTVAFVTFAITGAALVLFDLWGFNVISSAKPGAWIGVAAALGAFYLSAAFILNLMAERELLPLGKPLLHAGPPESLPRVTTPHAPAPQ